MTITHYGSGSSGNAFLADRTLIDCGLQIDYSAIDYDTLLITHAHSDHVKYIYHALKYTKTFFAPDDVIEHIKHFVRNHPRKGSIVTMMIEKYQAMDNYFPLNHDVPCYGYDLGEYVHLGDTAFPDVDKIPKGRTLYFIESNYDYDSLLRTNRPHSLINRIMQTHMSNEEAWELAQQLGAQHVIYGHLSQEANSPSLARATHKVMGRAGMYPMGEYTIKTEDL